jgi:hypothetical protein
MAHPNSLVIIDRECPCIAAGVTYNLNYLYKHKTMGKDLMMWCLEFEIDRNPYEQGGVKSLPNA